MIVFYIALVFAAVAIVINAHLVRGGYNDNYLSRQMTSAEKGIAAVFIVIHHLSQKLPIHGAISILGYIGFILVAVFFFISGYGLRYGIEHKEDYLRDFFRKRLLSVYIPYWIVLSLTIIAYALQGIFFSPVEYALSVLGLDHITGTWYVTAIIVLYCIFWLSYRIGGKYRDLLVLGLVIVYCLICKITGANNSYTASIAAFYLGIVWVRHEKGFICWLRRKYRIKTVFIGTAFLVLFSGRLIIAARGIDNELIHIILRNMVSVSFVLTMIALTQKFELNGTIVEFLGSISYELYLVHYVLIYMLLAIENKNVYITITLTAGFLIAAALRTIDKSIMKKLVPSNNLS